MLQLDNHIWLAFVFASIKEGGAVDKVDSKRTFCFRRVF